MTAVRFPKPQRRSPKPRKRLATRKPLKRSPMRRKAPRRLSKPGAAAGRAYLNWVKTLPCAARFISPCWGPMDPHHAGRRPGTGLKAPDNTAIPLCRKHHREIETLAGVFKTWTKALRLAWYDEAIAFTRDLFVRVHREAGLPVPGAQAA